MFGLKRRNLNVSDLLIEMPSILKNDVRCDFCNRTIDIDVSKTYDVVKEMVTIYGKQAGEVSIYRVAECEKCGYQKTLYQRWPRSDIEQRVDDKI